MDHYASVPKLCPVLEPHPGGGEPVSEECKVILTSALTERIVRCRPEIPSVNRDALQQRLAPLLNDASAPEVRRTTYPGNHARPRSVVTSEEGKETKPIPMIPNTKVVKIKGNLELTDSHTFPLTNEPSHNTNPLPPTTPVTVTIPLTSNTRQPPTIPIIATTPTTTTTPLPFHYQTPPLSFATFLNTKTHKNKTKHTLPKPFNETQNCDYQKLSSWQSAVTLDSVETCPYLNQRLTPWNAPRLTLNKIK